MLPLAQKGYTRQEVIDVLHGKYGERLIDFRFLLLDKADKQIGDISHLVIAESSEIQMDNESEIHRSAKFKVIDTGEINYLSDRIQPITKIQMPDRGFIEFPLGVFLLSTPGKEYVHSQKFRNIDAYDKLQILIDDGFTARFVADEGAIITDVVKQILTDASITKINIEPSDKTLPTWLSWDPDVSRLEVVNDLLSIINYEKIFVDEYGFFTSRPYKTPAQRSYEYEYRTDDWSIITPGATLKEDYFSVPNQWVGVVSEPDRVPITYTYENNNLDSPTSIPNRGRTITKYVDVDAVDIQSLQGIVEKQAFKDSQVYTEMEFSTALMPMHSHNDIYWLEHNMLGVNAKFQEISWSMKLSANAPMKHVARQIINL